MLHLSQVLKLFTPRSLVQPHQMLSWMGAVLFGVGVPWAEGLDSVGVRLEQVLPDWVAQLVTQRVDTAAIYRQIAPSTVRVTVPLPNQIDRPPIQGSGVIVGRNGETYAVLTNWHVVQATGNGLTVTTQDGIVHSVVDRRALTDLDVAVLYFESNQRYQPAPLGDSEVLQPGDPLYAVGYPNREYNRGGRDGTIDSFMFSRRLTGDGVREGYRLDFTDGRPTPGMSGSPLVNSQGQVVGLYGLAESFVTDQLYGVPMDLITSVTQKLGLNLIVTTRVESRFSSNSRNTCGNQVTNPQVLTTSHDASPYTVWTDYRRGQESIEPRACGRQYWAPRLIVAGGEAACHNPDSAVGTTVEI